MTSELKPCPFCGNPPSEMFSGGVLYARCRPCGVDHYMHIAAWNRRELESASQPGGGEAEEMLHLDRLADHIADNWPDKKYGLEEISQRLHAMWPQEFMPASHVDHDSAGEWQPIETAPKDCEVWAFNGEQGRMQWSKGYADNGEGWALWIWSDETLSDIDPEPEQPTHWMPLPDAPSAGNGGAEGDGNG